MTRKPTLGFDENNIEHETIHRRQSERRSTSRRNSKPLLLTSVEKIKKLRKLDGQVLIPLRVGDRRQSSRRKSRLSFLSIDEIKQLRKK